MKQILDLTSASIKDIIFVTKAEIILKTMKKTNNWAVSVYNEKLSFCKNAQLLKQHLTLNLHAV